MENFFESIKKKIKKNIQDSKIEIIDNTDKHVNHKSFQKNKLHLSLIIVSNELKVLNKIDAHKKIMGILSEELKSKIHALEIKIK
tara:strand:+ start:144 stop:398 length:255 start_codon:yes stop_codon:yes gene_type:complete